MTISFEGVQTVEVNGTTLAYHEQGQGEPVVFVHGGISDLRTWQRQLSSIGRSHRAIAYSRRFSRPNAHMGADVREDISLVAVEDLAAFLQEVGATPAHVVGNSYGAYVGLVTAIRYPRLVRTLVVAEPPVLPLFVSIPPRPVELLRLLLTRPRTAIGITQFGGTMAAMQKHFLKGKDLEAAQVFTRGVLGKKGYERVSEGRWDQILENLDELQAVARGVAAFPPIDSGGVREIRAPVLLMTGDESPMHLKVLIDRLQELLPNVERLEVPQASHLMHEDNAPAVNEAIVDFIGRHPRESKRSPM